MEFAQCTVMCTSKNEAYKIYNDIFRHFEPVQITDYNSNLLLKFFSYNFSCTFNSTLDDIRGGRERDGDVDPIWNDKDGNSRGYCLCNEVIYTKRKSKNI